MDIKLETNGIISLSIYRTIFNQLLTPELFQISPSTPDPILIARTSSDDRVALISALFAYGRVKAILKFLDSFPWEGLKRAIPIPSTFCYRFQNSTDIDHLLGILRELGEGGLKELFLIGYSQRKEVMDGIGKIIDYFYSNTSYRSQGFQFLIGKIPPSDNFKGSSPYKRWNMFLRWMVRDGPPDLGRWDEVSPANLLIPLDVHTHRTALRLGLVNRKSADLETVYRLTNTLRQLDGKDPVKYDFLLYRLGQWNLERQLLELGEIVAKKGLEQVEELVKQFWSGKKSLIDQRKRDWEKR